MTDETTDIPTTEELMKGFSTEGPVCPTCEAKWTCDEPYYYNENGFTLECDECGTVFSVQPVSSWSWTSRKIKLPPS